MSEEKELDCTNASRGVWLVKVPKYISMRWEKAPPMTEIGRLKINKCSGGRPDILFNLSDDLINETSQPSSLPSSSSSSSSSSKIPIEHRFAISDIKHQTIAVFSQNEDSMLSLEGNVVQKGECRPIGDSKYMSLKMERIKQASQPKRTVQQLDKAVVAYKPISAHKSDIEFEQKRKTEGKKSRDDKDKVQDVLFAAFEKHQYYTIRDLEKITKQPIPYLKEILKEICNYNAKNPHKNMWELKPEFRHYKG